MARRVDQKETNNEAVFGFEPFDRHRSSWSKKLLVSLYLSALSFWCRPASASAFFVEPFFDRKTKEAFACPLDWRRTQRQLDGTRRPFGRSRTEPISPNYPKFSRKGPTLSNHWPDATVRKEPRPSTTEDECESTHEQIRTSVTQVPTESKR